MSKPDISYHSPSQCKCFVNTGLGCIESQLGLSSTCVKQLALTCSGNLLARLSYLSSALPAYIREAKMSQKKQSMWFRTIFKEGFSFFLPPVNWSLTNTRLKQILLFQTTNFPLAYCLAHQTPYVTYPHHLVSLTVFAEDLVGSTRYTWLVSTHHSTPVVWVVPMSPGYSIVVQFLFTSQTEETQPGPPCP